MARNSHGERWGATALLCRGVLLVEALLVVLVGGSPEFSEFAFLVEPFDTIAVRDQPALLNCSASHESEPPEIEWIRDDVFLNFKGDTRRHQLENGSLYFQSIEHSRSHRPDEGIYQCVATVERLGTIVSRKAKLQVAYLGKNFNEEPRSLAVHLGDTAMFACDIDGSPRPTVTWYKDELEVDAEHVNYIVHRDGVLEISTVSFSDFGRYKCEVENVERSRTSQVAELSQDSDVSTYQGVPPRFIMEPLDQTVTEGTTIMLYCAANGRDRQGELPKISWLKDGVTIDLQDLDSEYKLIGHGSLQIKEISEKHQGSYTCRATNIEDSVDIDASIKVHVPPRFAKRPHNVFAHVNADVQFDCDVYGVPKPKITWMKNGDVVIPSDYFQIVESRNLRILGLVNSDDGLYQCLAENEVGNIQASAQLVILQQDTPLPTTPSHLTTRHPQNIGGELASELTDLPSAPTHLQAVIVSTRFVTLGWQMPERSSSEVTTFSVFWREEGSNRERVMNVTQLEANVQHLKPATKYEFRVQAFNRAGPSKEKAEITVNTDKEVHVPKDPSNLRAHPLSASSIEVTWDPPAGDSGQITQYKLYFYKVGANEEQHITVQGQAATLKDLHKFMQYSFRVVAYNNNGPGMSTEEVVARTYSDVPDEPPQNCTLETASSTSIIVRWEPPPEDSQNGIITGYKIRFKRKGSRGSETATTDGNRRAYPLTDLAKGTEYLVRIQAQTINGSSPTTPWLTTETFQNDLDESTVPGQPTSLRVRPFSSSIVVSWTPPHEANVMVRGYILGYGIGIPDVYKQVIDSKQRYYTIKNLDPSSEYVISLRTYNNMGEGRPIYETVITREETTPEPVTPMIPPVGLKATVLSPTTIVVTWSDATLGRNQRIMDNRFYTIRYNQKGAKKLRYVNSTDLNVHIDDLRPNTEYEFTVKVIKGRRQSTFSMSVFNHTFEDAPATAPRDLTPVAVESQPKWITLNWQPPRQPNGQITGYLVFYTTDATQNDRDWVVEGVLGDKLSTTIRELTPQTTYYFKVQARNSKGYGPMSPTVIFRTPRADGTGGGKIETPNDYGQNRMFDKTNGPPEGSAHGSSGPGGIPSMVLYIVIGCIVGAALIAIILVTAIVCYKRNNAADQRKRKGYVPTNKGVKGGPKDVKPPDLWIHDMELKNMVDKANGSAGGNNEGTMPVAPMPRQTSEDMKSYEDGQGDHHYDSHDDERQRLPIRPKPIMIPVEQPPPPREPIATAIPNGHLLSHEMGLSGRPLYPRTQYNSHLASQPPYSSTPRVNASDLSQASSDEYQTSTIDRRKAKSDRNNRRHSAGKIPPQGLKVLTPRQGLTCSIKPQQQTTSPYKKPNPPVSTSTTPVKPRSPLPVVTPKAPDVTMRSGDKSDSELPKSYSAEELSAEMANLEGLMKDLTAITQQEFEC